MTGMMQRRRSLQAAGAAAVPPVRAKERSEDDGTAPVPPTT
jgi:hypothetical protein